MTIENRLATYFDHLFSHTPQTKGTWELKEELYANSLARYHDAMERGCDENQAFQEVTESIGDIDALLAEIWLEDTSPWTREERIRNRAIRSGMLAIAASLSVLVLSLVVATYLGYVGDFGYVIAVLGCVFPVGFLVLSNSLFPSYEASDDSLVEAYKSKARHSEKRRVIEKNLDSVIGMLTLVFYFLISFKTGAWHLSWLIFLLGPVVSRIVKVLFIISEKG